jgi:Family of unknown function (DUF5681)
MGDTPRTAKTVPTGLKPWRPGQSGNPKGRVQGSRHKTSLAVENLLDGEAEVLTRKAIELAKDGDLAALRLCMDRICPVRRDRHVAFTLPTLKTPADAMQAISSIAQAVSEGQLTPSEAGELAKLLDGFARVVETVNFEARLAALESKAGP